MRVFVTDRAYLKAVLAGNGGPASAALEGLSLEAHHRNASDANSGNFSSISKIRVEFAP
jgi:hypothetical protein